MTINRGIISANKLQTNFNGNTDFELPPNDWFRFLSDELARTLISVYTMLPIISRKFRRQRRMATARSLGDWTECEALVFLLISPPGVLGTKAGSGVVEKFRHDRHAH